jgi:glutamate N-acetyltransferase/amino-acid N-acetyltransferase
MEPEKTVVKFGGLPVYANGVGSDSDEEKLREVMSRHDIVIDVEMGLGEAGATVWSCDFSYEYVKINGEYHT